MPVEIYLQRIMRRSRNSQNLVVIHTTYRELVHLNDVLSRRMKWFDVIITKIKSNLKRILVIVHHAINDIRIDVVQRGMKIAPDMKIVRHYMKTGIVRRDMMSEDIRHNVMVDDREVVGVTSVMKKAI